MEEQLALRDEFISELKKNNNTRELNFFIRHVCFFRGFISNASKKVMDSLNHLGYYIELADNGYEYSDDGVSHHFGVIRVEKDGLVIFLRLKGLMNSYGDEQIPRIDELEIVTKKQVTKYIWE